MDGSASRQLVVLGLAFVLAACMANGPLQDMSDGSETTISFVFDRGAPKSTGFGICTTGSPVELIEVEPIEVGGGAVFLGSFLLAAGESPIGTVNGFPPEGYEQYLEPTNGAVLDLQCGPHGAGEFAQVVVGLDWSDDSGGEVNGFRVFYFDQGSRRSLDVVTFRVKLCGAAKEYCDD